MNIWIPFIKGGSGTDSFSNTLASGLRQRSHKVTLRPFPQAWQISPDALRGVSPPSGAQVAVTNSHNGFGFSREGLPMVTVVHHWVHASEYAPYRSPAQAFYHDVFVRRYERRTFEAADALVAVSRATRRDVAQTFPRLDVSVIHNGVDTDVFSPGTGRPKNVRDEFVLLFVGNLTKRKGADLLAPTMELLGPRYRLDYTAGLRGKGHINVENAQPLGQLTRDELVEAYRNADALFLPSRLEGGPLVALEAMACGLPVVGANTSAVPEAVVDGETGLLCDHDPERFASAISRLSGNSDLRIEMSRAARKHVTENFRQETMVARFEALLREVAR